MQTHAEVLPEPPTGVSAAALESYYEVNINSVIRWSQLNHWRFNLCTFRKRQDYIVPNPRDAVGMRPLMLLRSDGNVFCGDRSTTPLFLSALTSTTLTIATTD